MNELAVQLELTCWNIITRFGLKFCSNYLCKNQQVKITNDNSTTLYMITYIEDIFFLSFKEEEVTLSSVNLIFKTKNKIWKISSIALIEVTLTILVINIAPKYRKIRVIWVKWDLHHIHYWYSQISLLTNKTTLWHQILKILWIVDVV